MADESLEGTTSRKDQRSKNLYPIIAKVVEVVLSIFIIGLSVDPLNSIYRLDNRPSKKLDGPATIYVSVVGYLLINVLFIISHVVGDRVPKRTYVMFAAVGFLLHIVAGSVMVSTWRKSLNTWFNIPTNALHSSKLYNDMLISAAVFTFVNAAVFASDIFLAIRFT